MVDVCNWVNELINTSNSKKDAFWDVENKINGIKTLFFMGHIVREDHQEILNTLPMTLQWILLVVIRTNVL